MIPTTRTTTRRIQDWASTDLSKSKLLSIYANPVESMAFKPCI